MQASYKAEEQKTARETLKEKIAQARKNAKGPVESQANGKVPFTWPADALKAGKLPAPDLGKATVLFNMGADTPRDDPNLIHRMLKGSSNPTPFGPGGYTDFAVEVVGRTTGSARFWGLELFHTKSEEQQGLNASLMPSGKIEIWGIPFFKIESFPHAAIITGDEFNTVLLVVRGQIVEVYVNGVAVCNPITCPRAIQAASTALKGDPGVDGQIEFKRITIYSAEGLPTPAERLASIQKN
jgi:hypothetical protein